MSSGAPGDDGPVPAVPAAVASRPSPRAELRAAPPGRLEGLEGVVVRRSPRRQRTVTAFREAGVLVVCIPAAFSADEERAWVPRMVERLRAQEARRRPDDAALARRAAELSARHLGSRSHPSSVRWVGNQHARWGSASTADGSIRLSDRLRGMPAWVVDYVLVHELAHLIEPGHDEAFWALVSAYPRAERARGYLEGFTAAADLPAGEVDRLADDGEADGDGDGVVERAEWPGP